jgi:hypothetical protein
MDCSTFNLRLLCAADAEFFHTQDVKQQLQSGPNASGLREEAQGADWQDWSTS